MGSLATRFDLHITDRKRAENPIADNLFRLENILDDPQPIDDSFPNEHLAMINTSRNTHWSADYANYMKDIVTNCNIPNFQFGMLCIDHSCIT